MNDTLPVVVTFAVPDESRAFVATLANSRPTVFHTGVGDTPAHREKLRAVLADVRPRLVVSAGYAGGLQPGVRVGDLVLAQNFSPPALLAAARVSLADEPLHVGTLLTQTTVAETAAGKLSLGAPPARSPSTWKPPGSPTPAPRRAFPLLSLRVVSDAAGQSFPVPGHVLFDPVRQRPRYVALPLWLLAHPARIAPFAAFVRGLGPARARLARACAACSAGRTLRRLSSRHFHETHPHGYPADRHPSPRQLFRRDAPGHLAPDEGERFISSRIPRVDHRAGSRPAARIQPGRRPGFSRLRPRPGPRLFLFAKRRTAGHRTRVDSEHRHPHGTAGARPFLQGQGSSRGHGLPRSVRLPRAHGRRHPALRQRRGSRRQGPEAAS